jgi:hypothetical protein
MANLTCPATFAAMKGTIHDHSTADAGTSCDIDQVPHALPSAEPVLCESSRIAIICHARRNSHGILDPCSQRGLLPSRNMH